MVEPIKSGHGSKPEQFTLIQNLIIEDTVLSDGAKLLYVVLSKFVSYADVQADTPTAEVYPSTATLATLMGYKKWTPKLAKDRDELRGAGLLSWIGQAKPGGGGQGNNLYTLTRKLPANRISADVKLESLPPLRGTPSPQSGVGATPNQGEAPPPSRGYEIEPLEVEPLKENQVTIPKLYGRVTDADEKMTAAEWSNMHRRDIAKGDMTEAEFVAEVSRRQEIEADKLAVYETEIWESIPAWVDEECWAIVRDRNISAFQLRDAVRVVEAKSTSSRTGFLKFQLNALAVEDGHVERDLGGMLLEGV